MTSVIASKARQSSFLVSLDCFVAALLAMTGNETACGLHDGEPPKRRRLYRRHIRSNQARVATSARRWRRLYGGYDCKLLVWYEMRGSMEDAILREKQIKGGSRPKKLALIEAANPSWADLWSDIAHP